MRWCAREQGRERLLRYGLRPPFAYEQLQETSDGRIAFALRKPRKNGDTHRFLTPVFILSAFETEISGG